MAKNATGFSLKIKKYLHMTPGVLTGLEHGNTAIASVTAFSLDLHAELFLYQVSLFVFGGMFWR